MAQIEYRDVTGVFVYFSQEQIAGLLMAMSPEQRRFSRVLADTIQNPHEIWKAMREDKAVKGKWNWSRFYIQYLDLTETDIDENFGAAVMGFTYNTRWELETVGLLLGSQENVMDRIDEEIRKGACEYSAYQH
ncbi:PBECR2 nuclease fold domain-containing protein [Methylomonas sp. HW2-6]|uniref:PBECR2 nuclease fold domain-containing protein n=1 Tax=Methylomonas sp. HW2-6 TaxID=3376687 RepID=UPI004042CD52